MLLTESQNNMITEAVNLLEQIDTMVDTQDINDPSVQPKFHELLGKYGSLVESIESTGSYASEVLNERLNG